MSKENENVLWCIAHFHSHQEKRSDLGGEPWNYRAGSQGIFDLSRGSSLLSVVFYRLEYKIGKNIKI